jgi:hypothetical protein
MRSVARRSAVTVFGLIQGDLALILNPRFE